ncbi:MAG TPA: galactose oxidase early set domain-containing protein [Bdellovibrionota bacterium]|nr:galactose oxidase early set domain-containing protein [Bdellovibrionota bacterium]
MLAMSALGITSSLQAAESWGPVVQLRDRTAHFQGTPEHPMPEGGWWVTPIHATLLGDGKALITGWGRFDFHDCRIHRTRQNGESFLIDPKVVTGGDARTLYLDPINEQARAGTTDVLYCAGNVTLRDGRVLFVGGARYEHLGDKPGELEYGLSYSRLYDPRSGRFERVDFAPQGSPHKGPGMDWYEDGMMWYPTETRLPGGKILVTGGFDKNCTDATCMNRDVEIFDPDSLVLGESPWTTWVSHDHAPGNVYDPGIKDYTHSILLYQPVPAALGGGVPREVVLMGWPGRMSEVSLNPHTDPAARIFVPKDDGHHSFVRPGGAAAWDSSAALVGTGEILVVGGGPGAKAEAQRIDLFNPKTGTWRSKNMGITRHNPAATLLPDGRVLIVNGEPGDDVAGAIGDRHRPQIYDPYTDDLQTLAGWPDPNPADRGYHSFSLLLKDGRILLGGGMVTLAQVGCERPDLRVFNPPYLTAGPRPVLAPQVEGLTIHAGGRFGLEFTGPAPRADRGVALMALGSETHSFDQNQRYVPLTFEQASPSHIWVNGPADTMVAPEGNYVLYLISAQGVPSEGRLVHVAQ